MTEAFHSLLARCVSVDRLEASLGGTDHLIGHNILRHDLVYLAAERPRLARLANGAIDTLWLNPLAFPRNPYHHLVKHYQDGRLQTGHVNDPELDARLVFLVLANQLDAFRRLNADAPDALAAYHFLTTRAEASAGFDAVFRDVREAPVPSSAAAGEAVLRLLSGHACERRIEENLERLANPPSGWPMAYALAWISVAGGDSVMPPWVRLQFREASSIVHDLRDTPCDGRDCAWCAHHTDPKGALSRWFGFDAFSARSRPTTWAGPCRSASSRRPCARKVSSVSCRPEPENPSATRSRPCPGSSGPGC